MLLLRTSAYVMAFIVTWASGTYVEDYPDHFINDFVVQIDGDDVVADLVARTHGFKISEKVRNSFNRKYVRDVT